MSDELYRLYEITCSKTQLKYVGLTKTINPKYNPLPYFVKVNAEDEDRYYVIAQSIAKYGYSRHAFKWTGFSGTQEECKTEQVYILKSLPETLNGGKSNYRHTCPLTGYRYSNYNAEKHQLKIKEYQKGLTPELLEMRLNKHDPERRTALLAKA